MMAFLGGASAFAQNPPQQLNGPIPYSSNPMTGSVLDAQVIQAHIPTKKVIEYPHLREADYIWSKRVWRTIDLREKFNFPLYYPLEPINNRISLYDILKLSVEACKLTAFQPLDEDVFLMTGGAGGMDGDQFKYPVVPQSSMGCSDTAFQGELANIFNVLEKKGTEPVVTGVDAYGNTIYATDPATGAIIYKDIVDTFQIKSKDIIEYHVKEDWFFDKQRSVLDVRILGIAPVRRDEQFSAGGGKREMFWIYFPEARYILQNFFVYNERNDARRMSFDDLFWKRKFTSYVDKETNVFDRTINDYKLGIDALLEAEDIKNDIFLLEHDVWHF